MLDKYLRQFPEHPDERRQLIELYIDTAQLASARQHIRILFDSRDEFKHDVDLLDKAASCEFTLGDVAQAVKYLDDAIATKKAPPRIVERLLNMLLGMKAFNDPRYTPAKYIEILTNQEPYRNDIDARIAAGLFLLRTGEMENARRHIAAALAMPGAATNSEALMAAAALERAVMRKAPETIPSQLKKAPLTSNRPSPRIRRTSASASAFPKRCSTRAKSRRPPIFFAPLPKGSAPRTTTSRNRSSTGCSILVNSNFPRASSNGSRRTNKIAAASAVTSAAGSR